MGSRRTAVAILAAAALVGAGAARAENAQIAGLQVALRAHGIYAGPIDGVSGPQTVAAVRQFQQRSGLIVDGRAGPRTRAALGGLGRPLLGRRDLAVGAEGFDVSVLQFLLLQQGFCRDVPNGRFDARTAEAVRAFQRSKGLVADGIAGRRTLAALSKQGVPVARRQPSSRIYVVRPGEHLTLLAERFGTTVARLARANRIDPAKPLLIGTRLRVSGGSGSSAAASARRTTTAVTRTYVVRSGDSLTSIAERHGTTVAALARDNRLDPRGFLLIGARLRVPGGGRTAGGWTGGTASKDAIRASIDRWSAVYGVDPQLARALAWMESGFQNDVVSSVGARGVMQLLPSSMEFVQDVLLGERVDTSDPDANVRLGVRLLAHLLREWNGDLRLALAAWYQGSKAVRDHGVYKVSEPFVATVLALRGRV